MKRRTDERQMGNLASSSSISICAQRTVREKNRQELVQFFSFDTFIVWDSRQLLSTTCDQNTIASVLYGYTYDAKDCLLEGWCNRIHYASAGISHGFSQYLNRILQTKLAGILYSLLLFIGMRKSRQFFVALIFVLFALDVPDHQLQSRQQCTMRRRMRTQHIFCMYLACVHCQNEWGKLHVDSLSIGP